MSNLLIGGSDLYDWSQVKTWVRSARDSGHDGDIAIIVYRMGNPEEYVREAQKYGVDLYQIDTDQYGRPINHNDRNRDTQSHQMRFFHMWQFLQEEWKNYDWVVTTDIRDVYFQKNPFDFLAHFYPKLGTRILASSEGITYGNEQWGLNNMLNGFGPIVTHYAKEWQIYNVGVMAGRSEQMKNMFWKIYNLTVGRYIPSDQSAYNVLVNMTDENRFLKLDHDFGWACQCGTTLDPEKSHYFDKLESKRPQIQEGKACNSYGDPYVIVHQYDRVPELKRNIGALYD